VLTLGAKLPIATGMGEAAGFGRRMEDFELIPIH
jgi:hypothetical protein